MVCCCLYHRIFLCYSISYLFNFFSRMVLIISILCFFQTHYFLFFRYVFLGIMGPIFLLVLIIILINLLQVHSSKCLPHYLQTWSWLPRPFRTLAWYDELFCNSQKRLICCNGKESKQSVVIISQNLRNSSAHINQSFDDSDRLSAISSRL